MGIEFITPSNCCKAIYALDEKTTCFGVAGAGIQIIAGFAWAAD
jgi:hypothetical protein